MTPLFAAVTVSPALIVLIIVSIVLIGITVALYFLGKNAEKKRAEQDEQMAAVAQQVSMLIIDKKTMKMKNAGLPEQVVAQAPWYARNSKLPVVKAKVGPQIMTFICDAAIFDEIPTKKEVKATVSGLYITKVKGLHGNSNVPVEKKKKGLRAWALRKQKELRKN